MSVDYIRYDILAQEALRGVVRTVLTDAARKGLQGEHHFFISFDTRAEGVRLSPRLREQYPEEITIVLQHQFWDLKVDDEGFEVGLSFAGVPEKLAVPYTAIKSFVDPSVQFALQFEQIAETADGTAPPPKVKAEKEPRDTIKPRRPKSASIRTVPSIPPLPAPNAPAALPAPKSSAQKSAQTSTPPDDKPTKPKRGGNSTGGEVVRLDRFRKK
jgi:uncharacterized protein